MSTEMEHFSDRVQQALLVRRNAVNDFFGGWEERDLQLLKRYLPAELGSVSPGEIVDWLGIRTLHRFHAWMALQESDCVVLPDIPVPDDQVHAETIEYVALLIAIERAKMIGDGSFTAFELGSSYSPWAVAGGVVAIREGFSKISLNAVEANAEMIDNAKLHARMNGVADSFRIVHGAITATEGVVYFPRVSVERDNGAQVSEAPVETDYRGVNVEYDLVDSQSLERLTNGVERVDFLHMDIQGAEENLLNNASFLTVLSDKVVTFFLATQSRIIEGIALKNLSKVGWRLVRERPTTYLPNDRTADVNGWCLRDGGQIWINTKFSAGLPPEV